MAEHRPFPPSSRRVGLAQRAGLTAASPQVVAAAAWTTAAIVLAATAHAAAGVLGRWIATACEGADAHVGATLAPGALGGAVTGIALPVVVAMAVAALAAHIAQTRSPWLPRRRLAGAPAVEHAAMARVASASRDLACAAALGGVAVGWLWMMAPRLARLPSLAAADALPAAAALIASFVTAAAIAWLAIGTIDALARHADVATALRMTDTERREDARLAAADPRWRARREAAGRGPSASDAVAASVVVLLGDDAAVAIAWHARLRPIPVRLATGRRARATQLVGLARRHRVPVHRDAALVAALIGTDGPVPEREWARLAPIVAASSRA